MMQHSFFLCKCLHPTDVRAVSDRPRAINNRPYEFYCRFCVFCNTPFCVWNGKTVGGGAYDAPKRHFVSQGAGLRTVVGASLYTLNRPNWKLTHTAEARMYVFGRKGNIYQGIKGILNYFFTSFYLISADFVLYYKLKFYVKI